MSTSILNHIYDELIVVMKEAQDKRDDSIVPIRAEKLGLQEIAPLTEKFFTAYTIAAGSDRVILQYRFYDASAPFSLAPDVNVYVLSLMRGTSLLREMEIKFPDKTIFG